MTGGFDAQMHHAGGVALRRWACLCVRVHEVSSSELPSCPHSGSELEAVFRVLTHFLLTLRVEEPLQWECGDE